MFARFRELPAIREPDLSTAAVHELQEELRAIYQLNATQEQITAVVSDREATVDMTDRRQRSITGRRGGDRAGLATATCAWRRVAAGSDKNAWNVLSYVALFVPLFPRI